MVVTEKEPIFDFEVFDEISKPEYVSIYKAKNTDEFLEKFYIDSMDFKTMTIFAEEKAKEILMHKV